MLSPPALQRLRGWEDVDDEIEEMYQEDRSEKEEGQFSVLSLCTFRGLRWQLISIIVMMMGQQLSGVNSVSGEGQGGTNKGWDCRGADGGSADTGEKTWECPFTQDTPTVTLGWVNLGQYQIHG